MGSWLIQCRPHMHHIVAFITVQSIWSSTNYYQDFEWLKCVKPARILPTRSGSGEMEKLFLESYSSIYMHCRNFEGSQFLKMW